MDQPTATLLASIIAASGSTLVGVAAVVFAWRQNVRTLMQQRRMAIEERLWQRREELYVRLLSLVLYKGGTPEDRELPSELEALAPQVVAFASDDVSQYFDGMLNTSKWPTGNPDDAYARDERLGIQLDSLMALVRWELQPDTKPAVRRRGNRGWRRALRQLQRRAP
jgi:hypothetical protein